jgi:regulator of sigma E protease
MLYFLIILTILVISHEFGHFLMSRIFHVDVEEFAFGFPPRIASFKKNGTTYAVNAIPLGGYVKIKGEEGTADPNDKNSFANQPV